MVQMRLSVIVQMLLSINGSQLAKMKKSIPDTPLPQNL